MCIRDRRDTLDQLIAGYGAGAVLRRGVDCVLPVSYTHLFFSKVFRVYAAVMFCCVAGVIWLCQPMMHVFREDYFCLLYTSQGML